jgi:hypothetical protein
VWKVLVYGVLGIRLSRIPAPGPAIEQFDGYSLRISNPSLGHLNYEGRQVSMALSIDSVAMSEHTS